MVTTPVIIGSGRGEPGEAPANDFSQAQMLMWAGQRLDPDLPVYNMIETYRIGGSIDPEIFGQAWASLVTDSDALRTTVLEVDGRPVRGDAGPLSPSIETVDLRSETDPEAAAAAWVDERITRVHDLSSRLWDTALILVDDELTIWYLNVHHLVSDGQTFLAIFREVGRRYELAEQGRLAEAVAPTPYRDYVEHEQAARASAGWAKAAARLERIIAEPVDGLEIYGRSEPATSARTERRVVELDQDRCDRVRALAESETFSSLTSELSRHAVWATVLAATLHRVGGASSMRIGSPYLGRPTPAFRDAIGLYIDIGAIHTTVEEGDRFADLGQRVLRSSVEGLMNARPGTSSAAINRSYQVLLNSVTSRFEPFAGRPVTAEWVHSGYGDRDHLLRLQVSDFDDTGHFSLLFDINTDVLDEAERAWLVEHFLAMLDACLADPEAPVGGVDLRSERQRQQQAEFRETSSQPDATVVELFARQVEQRPDAIAVEDGDGPVTYRELAEQAEVVAARLRQLGIGRGDHVAVCARRDRHLVAGLLGVLASGGAYVPIDPVFPASRRATIIGDAEAGVVLVAGVDLDDELDPDLVDGDTSDGPIVVDLRELADQQATIEPADLPLDQAGLDDRAYLIYTSGSTGTPKGAMLTHRGLANYLTWAASVYQGDEPRDFPLYSSISFDLTITSVFVPLISGGRVITYDHAGSGAGLEILDVMADDRVDAVKLTPAHLAMVLEQGGSAPTRIRRLILGGEILRTDLAARAATWFGPDLQLFNEYGPTEAVVGCMIHRFDPEQDRGPAVPVGRPAANTTIEILDPAGNRVPAGVVGELVISSPGVGQGYWKRPELTEAAFADDRLGPGTRSYRTGDLARWDAAGELEFLGRRDGQVKIRGARVELGEIEAVLAGHEAIGDVVVEVIEGPAGGAGLARADGAARHCVTCGLAADHPGASLDRDGRCRDCRDYDRYRHEVERYWKTPEDLRTDLAESRRRAPDGGQDCIILASGGKDSTYMLYQLVREFGVRPLVFTLDNGFLSESALDNVRSACVDLGLELHEASTPHMNAIFVDSLERHANVCDGCFKTVYTLSMSLARARGISTIITGLARGQLFETRLADTFAARQFDPDTIDTWIGEARKAYHHVDDAVYQLLERDLFVDDAIFDDIAFVDFYRYVDVDLSEVYRYLENETVWTRPPDTGRSTNCLINDVGIFVHKQVTGHHNYALPYSWDVRLGHKRRDQAMAELDDDIDITRVRQILDEIGFEQSLAEARVDRRLAAYYVANGDVDTAELRRHLTDRLPDFMVPRHLVSIPAIPLTVNGKIDRARLPDPGLARPELDVAYVAPSTEDEHRLAELWAAVLPVPEVGIEDNFFDLGGDSISAIQIASLATEAGLPLTARDIFAGQTIANLAATSSTTDAPTSQDPTGPMDPIDPIDPMDSVAAIDRPRLRAAIAELGGPDAIEDLYPLSPTQLGMVYHSLGGSGGAAYLGHGVGRLVGPINAERLRRAWTVVVARHPATRSRLVVTGLEQPMQVIVRDPSVPWQHQDWSGRDAEQRRTDREALVARLLDDGLRLEGGPLMGLTLLTDDDGADLIWTSHHAILDGWSAQLLLSEVLEQYRADDRPAPDRAEPTEPGLRFGDHVRQRAAADLEPTRRWWSEQLSGLDATTSLPIGPEHDQAPVHQRLEQRLPAEESAAVERYLRANRLTLGTLANGAWAQVIGHYASADDVLFGSTVSGRERTVVDPERCVGLFITTLPTRIRIDQDAEPGDWLRSVQADLIQVRDHDDLGLAEIQALAGTGQGRALFDSIVVVENHPSLPGGADLLPEPMLVDSPSNFPVAVLVHPGDELSVEVVFETGRVDEAMAGRFAAHLLNSMVGLTRSPSVGDVQLIGRGEAEAIAGWEQGPAMTPDVSAAAAVPVHERILAQAEATPGAIAVDAGDGTLTYRELSDRARALAGDLVDRGVRPGDVVGVVAGDRTGTFVALVATLVAGGVYLPLDPELPARRLAQQLAETEVSIVLSDGGHAFTVPDDGEASDAAAITVITVDGQRSIDGDPIDPVVRSGNDPAYVIYTSGSTARPKGVVITNDNIAFSTGVRTQVYGDDPSAFLLLSSLAFDSSMVGLFWTLTTGGRLVLPPGGARRSVSQIRDLLSRRSITHLLALPSLYGVILDEAGAEDLATLDTVIVAGEACTRPVVERHRVRAGHARLFNEYGPTEGTVWSHATRLDTADDPKPPIGRPLPEVTGVVLDHRGRRCGIGVPGELHLGGPGIAAGYLNATDTMSAAFLTGPLPGPATSSPASADGHSARWYRTGDLVRWRGDGQLDFLGRTDHQVKLRGHRIELAEIEAAIVAVDEVSEAVATIDDGGAGSDPRRLVAHYRAEPPIDPSDLRDRLVDRLPRIMRPSVLVPVDALPRTATGKVDRSALTVPEQPTGQDGVSTPSGDATSSDANTDAVLLAVTETWSEVLGVGAIGPDEDFFDLGGNSLDAMRMLAKLERRTGRALPLEALLRSSTAAGVAALLEDDGDVADTGPLVGIGPSGSKRPFFYVAPYEISIVEVARLGRHFDPDRPFYGLQPSGLGPDEEIDDSLEAMATRYVEEIKAVQPRGPYLLGGHCEGGLVAIEMARVLQDRGEEVGYVGVADLPPPPTEQSSAEVPAGRRLDRARYYASDRRLVNALRWQAKLWIENTLVFRFGRPEWRRIRKVRAAHAEAFERYRFRPDPRSPLHHIRSTELAVVMDQLSWYDQLTRDNDDVTVTDITSTHAGLLLEPSTAELARSLSAGLDRAEARVGAGR